MAPEPKPRVRLDPPLEPASEDEDGGRRRKERPPKAKGRPVRAAVAEAEAGFGQDIQRIKIEG